MQLFQIQKSILALVIILGAFTNKVSASEWLKGINAGIYGVRNYHLYIPTKAKARKNGGVI